MTTKRITGVIAMDDLIKRIDGPKMTTLLDEKKDSLVGEFGEGSFTFHETNSGRVMFWAFEYDDSDEEIPESPITPAFVEAVRLARVNLCNLAAVKQMPDGSYAAIDPADDNAVSKCAAINELERFLTATKP